MRLRSTTNSKPLFYRGISLEDYIRKSPSMFLKEEFEQTIIMDQFNRPLISADDYQFLIQQKVNYPKKQAEQAETKVSMTIGADQDQFYSSLQLQNQIIKVQNTSFYQRNFSRILNRDKKKIQDFQLPPIAISKSKNLRKSLLSNQQFIKKGKQSRRKCMASRQISQQSQDQSNNIKKKEQRAFSHRQPNENLKKKIQFKRHLSINRNEAIGIKVKMNCLDCILFEKEK